MTRPARTAVFSSISSLFSLLISSLVKCRKQENLCGVCVCVCVFPTTVEINASSNSALLFGLLFFLSYTDRTVRYSILLTKSRDNFLQMVVLTGYSRNSPSVNKYG